ncbi:MAG: hypothetical protein HC895_09370 [Leptolyngbyaceae cyanobacterium SM1_3_5]|nr:hypothetical protein [Leptolyngbyaceae cyanobacterium SM1_3_5]
MSNLEEFYQIRDESGQLVDYEQAKGRQLFDHYRHNMTNYDQVLDEIRAKQGHITGRQEKKASVGAAEQVLEKYRDEHVKVIQDSQKKGQILKNLMQKAGVGTASALASLLDTWSNKIKEIGHLENSQRTLQSWNDTYRVQRELVRELLRQEGVSEEVINKVNAVYKTRSVNKAVELAENFFDLEKSEILKLVKSAIRYTKV